MIRRLKISGYKSFQNLDVELQPLSVIFGPNASGKSNLLDAINFLSRAVSQKNLKEAFDGHRGFPLESFYQYGKDSSEISEKDNPRFTIEVDVELSDSTIRAVESIIQSEIHKKIITEKFLNYKLTIEITREAKFLRVIDEQLCAIKQNGEVKEFIRFLGQQEGYYSFLLEGAAVGGKLEVKIPSEFGLDYTIVSMASHVPSYPHISAFRMELSNWHTYYLEPKILMREEVPLAEIENIGPRGENLAAFLNTLKYKYPKDFDNLNLSLNLFLSTNTDIDIESSKEGLVGLKLSENGSWFSARLISEGTLRLIGLLAAVHPRNPATLVAFEEPENGVHPARIKMISDILKNVSMNYGKQIIVTTHSPTLAENFDGDNLFICRKVEGRTEITSFTSLPLSRRSNITTALGDRIVRGDFGG